MRKQHSEHTRAVNMAVSDINSLMDHLETTKAPFMERPTTARTARMHDTIRQSPTAMQLIVEGHPIAFAHRVAQIEKEQQ